MNWLPINQRHHRTRHAPKDMLSLRICVLMTVLRVSRSCELFPDEFDLHPLPQ